MTKNRFKQICNYFYSMKDDCIKLMLIECFMNVLNDDEVGC